VSPTERSQRRTFLAADEDHERDFHYFSISRSRRALDSLARTRTLALINRVLCVSAERDAVKSLRESCVC